MTKDVAEIIQQYAELVCDHNFSDSIAMEVVKAAEFERIADALEAISVTLDSIEQSLALMSDVFAECQVRSRHGNAIAVTGAIQQI